MIPFTSACDRFTRNRVPSAVLGISVSHVYYGASLLNTPNSESRRPSPALSRSGHCWVPPIPTYAYTDHANANVTGTANGLNQLTSVGGVSNSHDSRGNLTVAGAPTYAYSSENMGITVTVY